MIRSKRRSRFRFSSHAIFAVVVALSGVAAYKVYTAAYERYQINKQISNLDAKLKSISEESGRLQALIDRFQNKDEVEKEARKKLNLVKEGEKTVIITDIARAEGKTEPEIIVTSPHWLANPQKWYDTIFGN